MKIKMNGDTFDIDENVVVHELKNLLYDTGKVQMNSVNKTLAIRMMQNASKRVKTKEAKKILAELIVTLSTSDDIQFIKEEN